MVGLKGSFPKVPSAGAKVVEKVELQPESGLLSETTRRGHLWCWEVSSRGDGRLLGSTLGSDSHVS